METWEGYHVDSQFTEISVELARESETGGDSGHGGGDEMVQVTVGWGGEFQGSEADIVESLVVDTVGLVGVLNELVDRQGGVVGLNHGVGYLKNTKTNVATLNIPFNPFMLNVFSHPYQLDESISNFSVIGWYFSVLLKFIRNFCKQTVENLIRRRVLRRLIWFCTVCRCPTKRR